MSAFLQSLLTASLYGSVIIAAILLLRLLLRKAPKTIICLLWLLAAVRLLVPFQIESKLSMQPDFVQDVPIQLEQSMAPSSTSPAENPGIPEATPGPSVPVQSPSSPAVTTPVDPPISGTRHADPAAVAGWIWAVGAAGMMAYSAASYWLLRRRVADAVILSEGVWITKINTAMVLGFFRPRIYLNAGMDEQQRDFVLQHEKCHIRRGDHWWKPLGFLVLSIHWFNPLVWLGYILLCKDLEMACDEAVIRDFNLPQRKSYCAALLSCNAHRHALAICPVAFGEVSVKERIKNVLSYQKPTFWIILTAVIAAAVVALCFLTTPAGDNPEKETVDDWGITVSAENVTGTSVTFLFTQSGPAGDGGYAYGQAYTLEIWHSSSWEPVQPVKTPMFTKELLWLNLNGETRVHIDWAPFYGQLPTGYYRIGKTITNASSGATKTYHICFQLNNQEEATNTTGSVPPPSSSSETPPESYWPETPDNPGPELLALTELFGTWGTLYNSALTSAYESPAFINLCFFLEGVSKDHAAQLTEEEQAAFADYGIENTDVFRYTREEVDGYLQQYFGITSADLDEVAVQNLYYLESTDCFYIFTNGWDGHVRDVNVICAELQADGTILMYYTTGGWPAEKLIARIQPTDSGYIILSNQKA